jgi:hypothetical protein
MLATDSQIVQTSYFNDYWNSVVSGECSFKSVAAKISVLAFPIFIALAIVFATADFCSAKELASPVAEATREVSVPDPIEVSLENASQSDMGADMPSACAFHAVEAMRFIGAIFDLISKAIVNRGEGLSHFQRTFIQQGLNSYNKAVEENPELVEGAYLDHIRKSISDYIVLEPTIDGEGATEVNDLIDYLFNGERGEKRAACVTNINEQSFALIAKEGRVIIFDSHLNKLCMYYSKDQVRTALQAKITFDGVTIFEYALASFS